MNNRPGHPEKVNRPVNPIKKKPEWIRSKILDSQVFFETKKVVNQNNLVTVCQEANCPNITECWSKKHATFMIMGDTCTRACAFCDVKTGKPTSLDIFEPLKNNSLEYSKFKNKHKQNIKITNKELLELNNLFKKWDLKLKKENKIGFEAYYTLLTSKDGMPISKPPWGTISSIDLITGDIDWKIPFGYYKNKNVGVQNVGGLSATSSNLILY